MICMRIFGSDVEGTTWRPQTVLVPADRAFAFLANPFSTWDGCHPSFVIPSSSSARIHDMDFPKLPIWVSRILSPARFLSIRLMARPMTALAGCEMSPCPWSIRSCRASGPLTQKKLVKEWVLPPWRLYRKAGSAMDCTAAIRMGMYSGRQPAITPLTAMFQGVALRFACGSTATSWSGGESVYFRNSSTLSFVGGVMDNPSLHPFSVKDRLI